MTIVRAVAPVTRGIDSHSTEAALNGLGNEIRLPDIGICDRQRTCNREFTGSVNLIRYATNTRGSCQLMRVTIS